MEINKYNYEDFFLLYTDDELNAAERAAVEAFVKDNPELNEELQALLQTRLPVHESIILADKTFLYRSENTSVAGIDLTNYESYFLLYVDNELKEDEVKALEAFIKEKPALQAELILLQRSKLEPEAIIYEDKPSLYRYEKPVVPIAFQWRRIVAAAAIIAIGSFVWMKFDSIKDVIDPEHAATSLASVTHKPDDEIKKASPKQKNISENNNKVASPSKASAKEKSTKDDQPVNEKNNAKEKIASQNKYPESIKEHIISPEKNSIKEDQALQQAKPSSNTSSPQFNEPGMIPHIDKSVAQTPAVIVKPVLLDQDAFKDDKNVTIDEAISTGKDGIAYLDTDQTEKKSKGLSRGIFRKAARLVGRVTNADTNENESVVRIASFEIAKK